MKRKNLRPNNARTAFERPFCVWSVNGRAKTGSSGVRFASNHLVPFSLKAFMASTVDEFIRKQLLSRRERLQDAIERSGHPANLHLLLEEVDNALARIEDGSFGICEICHESVEADRLIADPLTCICLDHFTEQEKELLERDLQLAAQVQRGLLPRDTFNRDGWHICYHYEPAGLVSGDYCDIVDAGEAGLYFLVGDVSGKGVAASMLMAHLHAMFHTLTSLDLPLACMLKHASRVFCESTLPHQYATLVCGHAMPDGAVEFCNAGHPPPLLVTNGEVQEIEPSDLPIGLFGAQEFSVQKLTLGPGDGLVIYSDGLSEGTDFSGVEYSAQRLRNLIPRNGGIDASALVATCRDDFNSFRGRAPKADDVTLFVLSREQSI
jgi:phosphoserine phosphatase RsbU/P